ncbi:MAG: hypothetical protein M0Z30_15995 [Actinomycetota bacterium]|nr:hypothetical protein [Actinomycetota bacterium]
MTRPAERTSISTHNSAVMITPKRENTNTSAVELVPPAVDSAPREEAKPAVDPAVAVMIAWVIESAAAMSAVTTVKMTAVPITALTRPARALATGSPDRVQPVRAPAQMIPPAARTRPIPTSSFHSPLDWYWPIEMSPEWTNAAENAESSDR